MPHGLLLGKQDHESAHMTFKGRNLHGGSCCRIVPWDSVKRKELTQAAQPWQEKGCSPAHLILSLQSLPPAPQGLPQLLEGQTPSRTPWLPQGVPLLPGKDLCCPTLQVLRDYQPKKRNKEMSSSASCLHPGQTFPGLTRQRHAFSTY